MERLSEEIVRNNDMETLQLQGLSNTVNVLNALKTETVLLMFSRAKSSQTVSYALFEDVRPGDLDV